MLLPTSVHNSWKWISVEYERRTHKDQSAIKRTQFQSKRPKQLIPWRTSQINHKNERIRKRTNENETNTKLVIRREPSRVNFILLEEKKKEQQTLSGDTRYIRLCVSAFDLGKTWFDLFYFIIYCFSFSFGFRFHLLCWLHVGNAQCITRNINLKLRIVNATLWCTLYSVHCRHRPRTRTHFISGAWQKYLIVFNGCGNAVHIETRLTQQNDDDDDDGRGGMGA